MARGKLPFPMRCALIWAMQPAWILKRAGLLPSVYLQYHDLRGAKCLVVGAGTTALRKIRWLLRAGKVYVVAVKARDELQRMAKDGELTLQLGEFSDACITSDLRLIVSATSDTGINAHVYELAQQANVPFTAWISPTFAHSYSGYC